MKMKFPDTKTGYYSAGLFLIWPFLAMISAFKNYRSSWAKNIVWAFVAYYGFVFAIGSENESADIMRYINEYQNLHGVEMTLASTQKYYDQSGEVDVTTTFIAVLLSRFTDSQSILTLVYGLIFGFFFSRNMWFVLDRVEGNMKPISLLLFVCFFLLVPIWNMNGFRFWTAAHVYIYGLLPYLFDGKKSGVVTAALAILVHYAFVIPVAILMAYIVFGNRLVIYFAFFVTTFFISEINLTIFNKYVESYAPEIVQERTQGYRGEEYVDNYREGAEQEGRVWYAVWHGKALKWSVMGFLVILFIKSRSYFLKNKGWLSLFCFVLLFYGVANLFSSLPSGGRFHTIGDLGAMALITLYIQNREQDLVMERFVWAATPALLLYIAVTLRMGLYSMSATSILGNPFIALFLSGEHVSLNDVMRMLL